MKVSQNNSPIQMDAYLKLIKQQRQQYQAAQAPGFARTGMIDSVQLSNQAREIQKAAQLNGQAGDFSDQKVLQVKMDIENGTYKVNAVRVAADILREAFENNKILNKNRYAGLTRRDGEDWND